MITAKLLWHDYRYLPYERKLALREVESLSPCESAEKPEGVVARFRELPANGFQRLTYFKGVDLHTDIIIPDQARLEASALMTGQARLPKLEVISSLRRQSTRYSAHGLHEYRGKFNPQVVRAIGNILGMGERHWVLDPFCGSGTTLLEAAHMGWNAIGFDVNPLSILIANAKVAAFKTSPEKLRKETEQLLFRLEQRDYRGEDWKRYLPNSDYLAQWFLPKVLEEFACILKAIAAQSSEELKPVFRIALSDICRRVSLQDPGDLRIRRRKEPYPEFSAIADFSSTLREKIEVVCRARDSVEFRQARQIAIGADCRLPNEDVHRLFREHGQEGADAAITSPPYATALPYVDTQRLSLCLLGLIPASAIRSTERTLIGNREIGERERLQLEARLMENAACLPDGVSHLCKTLFEAAAHEEHGFRRRNLPALIYKYFVQMTEMFRAVKILVRRGGCYVLVVGGNKTTLQGQEIEIDTPSMLCEIAEANGWRLVETLPLDTYQRYDIHQKNSIRSEVMLILCNENPGQGQPLRGTEGRRMPVSRVNSSLSI